MLSQNIGSRYANTATGLSTIRSSVGNEDLIQTDLLPPSGRTASSDTAVHVLGWRYDFPSTTYRPACADSRFVFPHRVLMERSLSLPTATTWRVIKREAALPASLRLHDLRHYFASHTLLTDESLLVAGSLLGHSRPAMTARYAHLADDFLHSAAQRIGSMSSSFDRTGMHAYI